MSDSGGKWTVILKAPTGEEPLFRCILASRKCESAGGGGLCPHRDEVRELTLISLLGLWGLLALLTFSPEAQLLLNLAAL